MSDEEPEYEVESVQEAKVAKEGKRKKTKTIWHYRVRWKNYPPDEDTWEPIASFNGSEHLVDAFWERANTNGRDVKDLTQFKLGESFLPTGPPRRKLKRKATNGDLPSTSKEVVEPPQPEAETIAPPQPEEKTGSSSRPNKRLRGAQVDSTQISSASQSAAVATPRRGRRAASPEVIPDSDEEMTGAALQTYLTPKAQKLKEKEQEKDAPKEVIEVEDTPEAFDPLFDEPDKKVPAHIARKENPLVIMVDDPALTAEASLSVKTRAAKRVTANSEATASTSRRTKPGPGRSSSGMLKNKSSLLTAEKGAPKLVKGRYRKVAEVVEEQTAVAQVVEEVAKPPPTAEELLGLSGLDANAGELSDFEEENREVEAEASADAMVIEPPVPAAENAASASASPVLSFPGHNLFSDAAPAPSTGLFSKIGSAFNNTIFGPLSLGFDFGSQSSNSTSSRIYINLDSSVAVPARLVNAATTDIETLAPKMEGKGTPGKFYNRKAAMTLLNTVRAGGVAAQVAIDETASDDHKIHFQRFVDRLREDDLFVAVAGIHILVFCSAGNTDLATRLNITSAWLNVPEAIIVSQVSVENYSGYADATSNADDRRWIQDIAAAS